MTPLQGVVRNERLVVVIRRRRGGHGWRGKARSAARSSPGRRIREPPADALRCRCEPGCPAARARRALSPGAVPAPVAASSARQHDHEGCPAAGAGRLAQPRTSCAAASSRTPVLIIAVAHCLGCRNGGVDLRQTQFMTGELGSPQ
jgi:hypothetical protein